MGIINAIISFILSIFGKTEDTPPVQPVNPPEMPVAPVVEEPGPAIEVIGLFRGDIGNSIQTGVIETYPREHVNYIMRQNRTGMFVVGTFVDGQFVSQEFITRMDQPKNGQTFPGYFKYPNAPVALHQPGTHLVQFKFARQGANFKTGNVGEIQYVSPEFPVIVRPVDQ